MTQVTSRRGAIEQRLRSHRLTGTPFSDAAETVRWFGAMQSQDYSAAAWAVGMRTAGATRTAVDAALDAGTILRTHVLRPTWHFLHRDDAHWMLSLSGPRVLRGMAGRLRRLGLDAATVARSLDVFTETLSNSACATRAELGAALRAAGIAPEGQRLPHLLGVAELEARIISGPMRGSQATYALFEHRAPRGGPQDEESQLAELALRYFRSHGPAQLRDFAWWAGLTLGDARSAIASVETALRHSDIDGVRHWHVDGDAGDSAGRDAHLLPNFDEYTVAYRDRSLLMHPSHPMDLTQLPFGSVLSNVVLDRGRVVAAWQRSTAGAELRLEVRGFSVVPQRTRAAVMLAAKTMSAFLERDAEVVWQPAACRLS